MCGIFGYVGHQKALPIVLAGIQKLEYRGYDSSGVASLIDGQLVVQKKVGKIDDLKSSLDKLLWPSTMAISHTRWATHGKPIMANAHPHVDHQFSCAVVHNGIIENHTDIRKKLEKEGIVFASDTDTEVIAQLISHHYHGDLLQALQVAMSGLTGAFAIACIHAKHPNQIICAARESPLAIGIGHNEMFVASDGSAFSKHTKRVIYLYSSELAVITPNSVQAFDEKAEPITKEAQELHHISQNASKGQFPHYTLKEIYEQPQTLNHALLSRFSQDYGTAIFENLPLNEKELHNIQRIIIIACGTSYHAAMLGAYMLEERAQIPVQVEISSEFRYKNPIIGENTLAIALSQSGETADTLAAMRELKEKGATILGISNVQGSTLAREADSTLFLRAGPEIGVASTKAFTSQVTVLSLLTLYLARMRGMSQSQGQEFIQALTALPAQVKKVLDQSETIKEIAHRYTQYHNFFFLGRRMMYPTALEAALKLKEIAYVNANGYPAGEMKHGPIALIDESCPTVAFCADSVTYPKMISNLREVKARSGKILGIAPESCADLEDIVDDLILVPETIDELAAIPSSVAGQLLAYHFANALGAPIDQPRNLAKSVTVE